MSEKNEWDTFDDTFWLALSGALFAFLGLGVRAVLKSRCKEFNCCCGLVGCVRDPAPPGFEPSLHDVNGENMI